MSRENYNDNVFINYPFDNEYQKKFHAIVYTILRCGLIPHCALEHDDASENRIDKLYRLISFCRFGVHDISNTNLGAEDNLPRFNMPFELGVFLAAKKFGSREQKRKSILVFEKSPFLSKIYLSDLNGIDAKAHDNSFTVIIKHIRNWLIASGDQKLPGHIILENEFSQFYEVFLPVILAQSGLELPALSFNDYCSSLQEWLIQYT